MVAPLITGARKITKIASSLNEPSNRIAGYRHERKIGGTTDLRAGIAYRRSQRKGNEEQRDGKVKAIRNRLQYRNMLKKTGKGTSKSIGKKVRATNRGLLTLGSVLYPMALQSIFALLVLLALAVDDSWWGWIDFVEASLSMATICWVIATILGTYTMFIASFIMGKYLHHWKIVLAFIFCFSANWVPGIQLLPWVGIWISFIILHEK